MAGLDKILKEISAEAEASAEEILGGARKEADAIRAEAEKEAADSAKRFEKEAEKRRSDMKSRAVSAAALKKRQLLLAEKQRLISEVMDKAKTAFLTMPDDEYFSTLLRLIEKNAMAKSGRIQFNAKDLARIPADYAAKIESAAMKHGGRLALSRETSDIDGGFVLLYDGIEQNCSISSLFETNAEELSDIVRKLLFG